MWQADRRRELKKKRCHTEDAGVNGIMRRMLEKQDRVRLLQDGDKYRDVAHMMKKKLLVLQNAGNFLNDSGASSF
jgi:hypothetical protein